MRKQLTGRHGWPKPLQVRIHAFGSWRRAGTEGRYQSANGFIKRNAAIVDKAEHSRGGDWLRDGGKREHGVRGDPRCSARNPSVVLSHDLTVVPDGRADALRSLRTHPSFDLHEYAGQTRIGSRSHASNAPLLLEPISPSTRQPQSAGSVMIPWKARR